LEDLGLEWQNDENVHFVIDSKKRKMWFRLDVAKINARKAPIMLVLHGVGHVSRPSFYAEKYWNTIKPIDSFGHEQKGSWWLGENNEFFTSNLLFLVVEKSKEMINSLNDSKLFIYGSSMGGYGAILHGSRLGATAIYANVPQVKLLGSTYSENGMKPHFEAILGKNEESKYNDLTKYLDTIEKNHPLYFICENRFSSTTNYLNEHALYLIDWFLKNNINYHLEIVPTKGHNKNRGIREVRDMFEKYCLDDNWNED